MEILLEVEKWAMVTLVSFQLRIRNCRIFPATTPCIFEWSCVHIHGSKFSLKRRIEPYHFMFPTSSTHSRPIICKPLDVQGQDCAETSKNQIIFYHLIGNLKLIQNQHSPTIVIRTCPPTVRPCLGRLHELYFSIQIYTNYLNNLELLFGKEYTELDPI